MNRKHQEHLDTLRRGEADTAEQITKSREAIKDSLALLQTAYNLLDVHKRFGDQNLQLLQTVPRSVLYPLAAPSTPEPARTAVIERAEDGERLTHAQVKEIVDKAVAQRWLDPVAAVGKRTAGYFRS